MQVRSPADILPYIVRDLADLANIHTAAVLYDDTFGEIITNNIISSNEQRYL